jgi:hypothetical protein
MKDSNPIPLADTVSDYVRKKLAYIYKEMRHNPGKGMVHVINSRVLVASYFHGKSSTSTRKNYQIRTGRSFLHVLPRLAQKVIHHDIGQGDNISGFR